MRRLMHKLCLITLRFWVWVGGHLIARLHWLGIFPRRGIRRLPDIAHGVSPKQAVDVYRPEEPLEDGRLHPWVYYIHGGGWVSGDRKLAAAHARRLASHGIAVVTAGYRLAPEATPAEQLADVRRGLELAHEHAAQWGLDPERYALAGESAGANLSVRLAAALPDALPHPRALVPIYGVYDFASWEKSTRFIRWFGGPFVVDHLRGKEPAEVCFDSLSCHRELICREAAVLLVHGELDLLTPHQQSHALAEWLERCGHRVQVRTFRWMGHAFTYLPDLSLVREVRVAFAEIRAFLLEHFEVGRSSDLPGEMKRSA